jgi:hypothetical protein
MLEVIHMERDGDSLYYPSKAGFLAACQRPSGHRIIVRIEGRSAIDGLIQKLKATEADLRRGKITA